MGARRLLGRCGSALVAPASLGLVAALAAAGTAACNATSGTVAGAAVTTGLAAGLAVARRSEGDCYSPCATGTTCNRSTGLCDRVACRGECLPGEKCEESWSGAVRCLGPDGLAVQRSAPDKGGPPGTAGIAPTWKPVGGSSSAPADAKLAPEGDAPPPR